MGGRSGEGGWFRAGARVGGWCRAERAAVAVCVVEMEMRGCGIARGGFLFTASSRRKLGKRSREGVNDDGAGAVCLVTLHRTRGGGVCRDTVRYVTRAGELTIRRRTQGSSAGESGGPGQEDGGSEATCC